MTVTTEGLEFMTEEQTGAVEPEALAPETGDVAAAAAPENGSVAAAAPAPARAKAPEGPPRLRLNQLKPGEQVTGTVKNVAQFGAFVDIGAEQDGLVHISELSESRVRRVEDVVKPGQAVEVTILEVDTKRKRISLSMKPRYDVYEAQDAGDDDGDPAQTTMQAAFQRAQDKKAAADEKQRKDAARKRAEQDDILNRTLNNLRKNP